MKFLLLLLPLCIIGFSHAFPVLLGADSDTPAKIKDSQVVPDSSVSQNQETGGKGSVEEEGSGQECPICLDDMIVSDMTKVWTHPDCGRSFCKACISKWLEVKETCPMCIGDCVIDTIPELLRRGQILQIGQRILQQLQDFAEFCVEESGRGGLISDELVESRAFG